MGDSERYTFPPSLPSAEPFLTIHFTLCRNRKRDHRPVGQRTLHPSPTLPFASLFSPLFLLILRSVFSSFLLLPLRPSVSNAQKLFSYPRAALSAPSRSRDPIRYPISIRISPLLLFRPPTLLHAIVSSSCDIASYQSQLNSRFRICASSRAAYSRPHYHPYVIPRSLFSHLIYRSHSSISSAYQLLSVDARPSSIYPFFHVSFATSAITSPSSSALRSSSSTPSSPHVHPPVLVPPVRIQISRTGHRRRSFDRTHPTVLVRRLQILEARRRAVFRRRSIFSSLPSWCGFFFDLSRRASVRSSSAGQDGSSPLSRVFVLRAPDTPNSFWLVS